MIFHGSFQSIFGFFVLLFRLQFVVLPFHVFFITSNDNPPKQLTSALDRVLDWLSSVLCILCVWLPDNGFTVTTYLHIFQICVILSLLDSTLFAFIPYYPSFSGRRKIIRTYFRCFLELALILLLLLPISDAPSLIVVSLMILTMFYLLLKIFYYFNIFRSLRGFRKYYCGCC